MGTLDSGSEDSDPVWDPAEEARKRLEERRSRLAAMSNSRDGSATAAGSTVPAGAAALAASATSAAADPRPGPSGTSTRGKGPGKGKGGGRMTVQEALDAAGRGVTKAGKAKAGKAKAGKAKRVPARKNTTKEERAEVIQLIRDKDTERILKKAANTQFLRLEKARVWELIKEAFNAERSEKDHFSIPAMQGIYKRYRTDKRQKVDTGVVNSQESGFSLIENAQPMADALLADSSDEDENPERYFQ